MYREMNNNWNYKNPNFFELSKTVKKSTVKPVLRGHVGTEKSGLLRQVTSQKRVNSHESFYDKIRKKWPFNTGDCLIEVTSLAGLTVSA